MFGEMYFSSEVGARKACVKIIPNRAERKSKAERMASVWGVLQLLEPPPARPDRPSFPASRVRLASVAARYSWNFVLARPK